MKRMRNKIAIVLAGLLMFTSAVFPFGYEVKAAGGIFDSGVNIPRAGVGSVTNEWKVCDGVTFPDGVSVEYRYFVKTTEEYTPSVGEYEYSDWLVYDGKYYKTCDNAADASVIVFRLCPGSIEIPGHTKMIGPVIRYVDGYGNAINRIHIHYGGSKYVADASNTGGFADRGTTSFYYALVPLSSSSSSDSDDEPEFIDYDTYKSEAPSGTVIAAKSFGDKEFFDLKVHASDAKSVADQKLLVQNLIGSNTQIIQTCGLYPRRDLSLSENGGIYTLTWNNLTKNQAGAVSAVVYNQADGAYVIRGALDANGTAGFTGFILRPASTITICK